jgi:hypothetical protein
MDNQSINIAEINRNLQESYIHYDPSRVDFTINNLELNMLEQAGNSIWKDVFLASLGIGLSTLINGVSEYSRLSPNTALSINVFFNLLIAGICISLSIICLIVWLKNKNSFKKIIEQLKNKPKYKLPGAG